MTKKIRKVLKTTGAVLAGIVVTGAIGISVYFGKLVCDGILNQNAGNDTKQNSIKQLEVWEFDREAFHDRYEGVDFEILSADNNTIPGVYYTTTEASSKWVILIHGAGGDRECLIPLVGPYLEEGYNVVTYDQRGHGENSDTHVSFGIFEKHDVEALVDYVNNEHGATSVIVHGQSMGGQTAALYAATEHATNSIDAVILDSPVPGMELLMKLMFVEDGTSEGVADYLLACGNVYGSVVEGMKFQDGNTIEQAKNITVPCMVIISERDEVCLPEYVEQIYDNVAAEKKTKMAVDSKHIEGVIDNPEQYFDGVFSFLKTIE